MKGSLPISAAGHAAIIGVLLLLPAAMPSRPKLDLTNAVDVVFAPPPPVQLPAPPAPPPPPPPEPVVEETPPPPPPVVEQPPPPPAAQAEMPPPPPPKPVVKPRPRPPQPIVERQPEMPLPLPAPTPAPVAAPSPQVASLPPAPAAPVITSDYRSLLSGWLESHKHYPEEARQRGEEGRAVLRFRVDRMGRVLNYSVVSSTGFADLDAAIDNMMRGASLPPFPPSMAEPEIEVSVTIRYGLSH